jgi:hypothetical protein
MAAAGLAVYRSAAPFADTFSPCVLRGGTRRALVSTRPSEDASDERSTKRREGERLSSLRVAHTAAHRRAELDALVGPGSGVGCRRDQDATAAPKHGARYTEREVPAPHDARYADREESANEEAERCGWRGVGRARTNPDTCGRDRGSGLFEGQATRPRLSGWNLRCGASAAAAGRLLRKERESGVEHRDFE